MTCMKLSAAQQEPIIALLTRIYTEIRDIEEQYQLLAGGHDFRPRIEHFHDAIRAVSSQDPRHRETGGRLSIELLAYDLSCLRYLQSMPLSSFKPHGEVLSPGTDIVKLDKSLAIKPKRPDRQMRERVSELYQHYAVLFAALLKSYADSDFNERVEDLNQDVEEMHTVLQQMEALAAKKGSEARLTAAVAHLEEDGLRQALLQFIHKQKYKKPEELKKLAKLLKEHCSRKDKEIAAIESAHLNYVLAQLGIFEGSKDMLKKMAAQGMNLVGKFVEASIAQSRREMGR